MLERLQVSCLRSLLYGLVCRFFRLVTLVFFREVVKRGSHQIPKRGAVIFVAAPHANQFVDPLLLMQTCPRPVRFLMAASSMRRGIPGFFGRLLGCIGVERPADLAKRGIGRVYIEKEQKQHSHQQQSSIEEEQVCVRGISTKFTQQFTPSKTALSIVAPTPEALGSAPVERVQSDEVLYLKRPLERTTMEILEGSKEGKPFLVLPVIDQSQVYNAVFKVLEEGECLGIFPEGGSHDRAEMLPLKAGVAIMALGALARNPNLDLVIIPCGLNYFNPHRFRSRAMIEYGRPIRIERQLVELFKSGEEARREACGRLLDQIYYGLCEVTVNVPDYETLQVVQAIRRLYQPTATPLSTFQLLEVTRRFVKGYQAFKGEEEVKKLLAAVLEYNKLLSFFGLRDHEVLSIEIGRLRALQRLISCLLVLLIYGLAVLPGTVLNLPAMLLIDHISRRKAAQAVATSTVKLQGRDVLATWKLLVGLLLLPALYLLYALPLLYELIRAGVTWTRALLAVMIVALILLPMLSWLTVCVAERGFEAYRAVRPLWYSAVSPRHGQMLRRTRAKLKERIIKMVDLYGPKLMADFERQRIVPTRRPSVISTHAYAKAEADAEMAAFAKSSGSSGERDMDELQRLMHESSNISRLPSPIDAFNATARTFSYMRAGLYAMFEGGPGEHAASSAGLNFSPSPWSYVEPVEIDDIFFTQASATQSKSKQV